jgi:acetylornithine deacetylase/succinyl-diaminopimelate desuccinylase-like protein
VNVVIPEATREPHRQALAEVIAEYSAIGRLPTSPGEEAVAASLLERYRALGISARVEPTAATGSYALPIGTLSAIGAVAGALAAVNRWAAAVVAVLAAAAIADDVAGGRRWFRRAAIPRRHAYNLVAEEGDPEADRTVVILAHHDAAPSGIVFDQRPLRWIARRLPKLIELAKTSPPAWWPVIGAPLVVAIGAVAGSRWLWLAGTALCLVNLLAMVDIGRHKAVPGANDNLSGVAAQLAVARALHLQPVPGVRLIFLSAGAEEALQEGIRGYARRHFPSLGSRTWFINLESVGSGRLALLEGEGPVIMRDYQAEFKDLAADCAAELGIPLTRGLRSRNSTDGDVPRRHGYPVATIVSLDRDKLIPHYHQDSDIAEHVNLASVDDSVRLAEAIVRRLARP